MTLFSKGGFGPLFVLQPHAPCEAVRAVTARLNRAAEDVLELAYVLEGDVSRLRIPDARIGGNLWQHTCFEIFISRTGMQSYQELNFSPAGEWAAYAFAAYRDGGPLVDELLVTDVQSRQDEKKLELEARVRLDRLGVSANLSIGLSAVVEGREGWLSYWALRHAAGKPDFHHRDTFVVELA